MAFYPMMSAEDDQLAAEKRALEVEKLRADLEEHRWREELHASARERAALELKKVHADLEEHRWREILNATALERAELELKLQRMKLAGDEKPTRLQLGQFFTLVIGVAISVCTVLVSFSNYRKSVQDSARHDLQTAIEHYQQGWLTGIVELSAHGAEGLQTLVYGVDGAGSLEEKGWPRVTIATLDEVAKLQKGLTFPERAWLVAAQKENHEALYQLVHDLGVLKAPEQQPSDKQLDQLGDLICVRSKLRAIVGVPKEADGKSDENWLLVDTAAMPFRLGLPDC